MRLALPHWFLPDKSRFTWAASIIRPEPNDQILEIGCGRGHLIAHLGAKIKNGKITGIDCSKSMIKKAADLNDLYINWKVKLLNSEFAHTKLAQHRYHKVAAFNVNIFWKGSKKNFELLHHCLKRTGRLYVFYDSPSGSYQRLVKQITEKLQEHDFSIVDTRYKDNCFCIISKPASLTRPSRASSQSPGQ